MSSLNEVMEELTGCSTDKQAERVNSALSRLILDQPFWGVLAFKLVYEPSWWVPTFATDGIRCYFNPAFAASMSLIEIASVLGHEVYHCCAGHIPRTGGRDLDIWNQAIDFETNNVLAQTPTFKLPKGNWCVDAKYKDQAAEFIYEDLIKNCKKQQPQNAPGQAGQGGKGQGKGQPGKTPGKGSQGPGQAIPGDGPQPPTPGSGNSAGEILRAPPGTNAKQTHEEWQQTVIQAASQQRGTVPGWAEALVEAATKPKVNWFDLLREYATELNNNKWNWARPSRRHSTFILPSLHSREVGEITAVIDTSGSTCPFWGKFLAGIRALSEEVKPSKINVLHVDAAVASARTYQLGEVFADVKIKGGGGTAFEPAFEWVEKNAPDNQVLIYLTDLYGSFPDKEPTYTTIWVVMGDCKEKPPFGKHIILRDCET